MKQLVMTPAGLAAVRVQISPVNQVAGLLRLAASDAWHPQHGRLARRVRPLLAQPRMGILAELTPPGGVGSLPIVHLRPRLDVATWEDELAAIEDLPRERIVADLAQSGRRGPLLARSLEAGTVGRDVADALRVLWSEALADDWPRLERGLQAEVGRCAQLMATRGVGETVARLHARIHWVRETEEASIVLDKPIDGRRAVGAEGLVLLPNVFLRDEPLITIDAATEGITYPCLMQESLGDDDRRTPMARLIGTTRSRVLDALSSPHTTSALSARLELAPSTVSTHLKVLHTAGLVARRREGREVLYSRVAS